MGKEKLINSINPKLDNSLNTSWIVSLFVLFILIGCRQNTDRVATETSTVTMELDQDPPTLEEVQEAVSTFNMAVVDPTAELMETLCAKELTYGHSSGLIQDREVFIDDVVNGPFDFSSVEAPEQTIRISGNTAIVRHIFLAKATNAGQPIDIRIGNVQVFQKGKDGKLRLLARQAYKLPN